MSIDASLDFWQYPVITEKTFYEQNKHDQKYLGAPFATWIDKGVKIPIIIDHLKEIAVGKTFTCCQHIFWRRLIPAFKELGIEVLYTPHKVIGEDSLQGITIKPCPLYAVNFEDSDRNKEFAGVDYMAIERPYLFSFMGGYVEAWYLTKIRKHIFDLGRKLKNQKDVAIIDTGLWHFYHDVYSKNQSSRKNLDFFVKRVPAITVGGGPGETVIAPAGVPPARPSK